MEFWINKYWSNWCSDKNNLKEINCDRCIHLYNILSSVHRKVTKERQFTFFKCSICNYYRILRKLEHAWQIGSKVFQLISTNCQYIFRDQLYAHNLPLPKTEDVTPMNSEWWLDKMQLKFSCQKCRDQYINIVYFNHRNPINRQIHHHYCPHCEMFYGIWPIPNSPAESFVTTTKSRYVLEAHFWIYNKPYPLGLCESFVPIL